MLKGKVEILTTQETKNKIWKKGETIFYKKSVTAPNYCVPKFTATRGRYYKDFEMEELLWQEK